MPLWCEMPNLSIAEGQKIMKLKTELFGSDHVGFRTIGYDQKEDKMLHQRTSDNALIYSMLDTISSLIMHNGLGSNLGDYEDIRERSVIENCKMFHLDMEFLHTRTVILETDEHFNPIRPYCVSGCTPLDCETE